MNEKKKIFNVITWDEIKKKKIDSLEKELLFFIGKLDKVRSNKISLDVIRGLTINQRGKNIAIKNICDLSINENYQLAIEVENSQDLPLIIKKITNSNLGLNLVKNNKQNAYFSLNVITDEIKENLIKEVKNVANECRISFRNIREQSRSLIKKEKSFSENQKKIYEKDLEKIINDFQKEISAAEQKKVSELICNKKKTL